MWCPTRLREVSPHVCSLLVTEALGFLGLGHSYAKAGLDRPICDGRLCHLPMLHVKRLLMEMDLLGLPLGRHHPIREVPEDGEEVDDGCRPSLVQESELGEALEELFHVRVVIGPRSPAIDHRGCQRVGIPSNMMQEVIGVIEHLTQHLRILEQLIWNVRFGCLDVEETVDHFPVLRDFSQLLSGTRQLQVATVDQTYHAPCWAVSLM